MLKGLKSVDLKIIQMYHFRLKWKRYTYAQIGGTPTFLEWDSHFFQWDSYFFARWESWTPVFKILVRALGINKILILM